VNDWKIKQRPEEIKRVIRGGIEANRYIRSNREGTVSFLMDWMRIHGDAAAATYEAFLPALSEDRDCPEDGIRLVVEETKKAAKGKHEVQ
jgi:hypothetical protein